MVFLKKKIMPKLALVQILAPCHTERGSEMLCAFCQFILFPFKSPFLPSSPGYSAGALKPWHHTFDDFSGKVQPIGNNYHVTSFLQLWWNIYRTELFPHLSLQQQQVKAQILVDSVSLARARLPGRVCHPFSCYF